MRVLFLDDSHERQKRFKMHRIGSVLVQAYTYEEAIKALDENPPFDEAHLDHDLSDLAAAGKPDPGERTGTDVAKHIAAMPAERRPLRIILHSFNFAGRTRMANILGDVGIRAVVAPYNLLGS